MLEKPKMTALNNLLNQVTAIFFYSFIIVYIIIFIEIYYIIL